MKPAFLYSAQPIDAYASPEVAAIQTLERRHSIFNLYWLSCPVIDGLTVGDGLLPLLWQPRASVVEAVVTDVCQDWMLFANLRKHPAEFLAWWRREIYYTIFDCYGVLGGEAWVAMVDRRAVEAAQRIDSHAHVERPARRSGDVVYAVFGGQK